MPDRILSSRRQPLAWDGVSPPNGVVSGAAALNVTISGTTTLIDDSVRRVTTAADVATKRAQLLYYTFGFAGLPAWLPSVTHDVTSPLTTCPNLLSVDLLSYALNVAADTGAIAVHLYCWHFIPAASGRLNRAVFFCEGHGSDINDDETSNPSNIGYGAWRMISSLIAAGFDVFCYNMPSYNISIPGFPTQDAYGRETAWGAGGAEGAHTWLFTHTSHVRSVGSALRFFLTMPTLALSYALALSRFTDYAACGLSGGGWTTTVWAALDTRVARSYSVAGTQPLYMRPATNIAGDAEQVWPGFYQYCGYLDLYMLASHDRHHEQIYSRADDGVFGETQYAAVEEGRVRCDGLTYDEAIADWSDEIAAAVSALGTGTFVSSIDETSNSHQISWQTATHIVDDLTA